MSHGEDTGHNTYCHYWGNWNSSLEIKKNNVPGTDNIPAELFKFGGDRLKQKLKHIFSSIWINEKIPREWPKGITCPLHKKGDQLECANCRGITLLNVTYKVFYNILYTRLLPHVENKLAHYQVGFCPRKSMINQICCIATNFGKYERIYNLHPPTFYRFQKCVWQHLGADIWSHEWTKYSKEINQAGKNDNVE